MYKRFHGNGTDRNGVVQQQGINLFIGHILDIFIQYGEQPGVGRFGYADTEVVWVLGQRSDMKLFIFGVADYVICRLGIGISCLSFSIQDCIKTRLYRIVILDFLFRIVLGDMFRELIPLRKSQHLYLRSFSLGNHCTGSIQETQCGVHMVALIPQIISIHNGNGIRLPQFHCT